MAALDTGIDLPQVIGDVDGLERDIQQFRGLLQQEVDEAVRKTAEDFRDEVKKQIKQAGIKERTGELLNSWKVRPKGLARYEVRSTADHAIFLEMGTSRHTISGDGGGWLKFRPAAEKLPNYPQRNFSQDANGNVTGDFNESGLIVSRLDPLAEGGDLGSYVAKSVNHPGNRAYRYFENAMDSKRWITVLNNRVRQAALRAMKQSGLDL